MTKKQPTEVEIEAWRVEETLPNPAHILFAANSFYQRPDEFSVPAFQLTYHDAEGRFCGMTVRASRAGSDSPRGISRMIGEFRA